MGKHDIQVVLGTPTAAPPLWLAKQHPEILPLDERGQVKHEGTRRAVCLNSDAYWNHSKRIVEEMAKALGDHPQLIAWQIDNGIGSHFTEASFNEGSRLEWQSWLKLKYKTIERLNDQMGLRHWGQVVTDWSQIPMPMAAPTAHNPAARRGLVPVLQRHHRGLRQDAGGLSARITPECPVTTNLRALRHRFDHFDLAGAMDFVSIESTSAIKPKSADLACEIDMLRSLKKTDVRTPDGDYGFLGHGTKSRQRHLAGSQLRSSAPASCACSLINSSPAAQRRCCSSAGGNRASARKNSTARSCRITCDKDARIYREVSQIGEELKLLAPALKNSRVAPEVCILYTHDNDWALQQPNQPNKHFSLREHIQLIYNALHDKNIPVDFARPTEDLSKYRLVFAPSLHLLSAGEADRLKLYVQNGGTLVGTCNTGLVDEHHIAPDTGYPHNLTDLFGLEVVEFDALPPG